jgi:hypothetical protein
MRFRRPTTGRSQFDFANWRDPTLGFDFHIPVRRGLESVDERAASQIALEATLAGIVFPAVGHVDQR